MTDRARYRRLRKAAAIVGLAGLVLTAMLPEATGGSGLPADLQRLIEEAMKANRDVKRLAGVKAAAQEAVRPAGALDNPQATFGLLNIPVDTWSFAQEPMTQKFVGLSQKIPFPGKRRLRSAVAEEQARADDFSYQDKLNEIRARVIESYWNLALAYAGYDLTEKNKHYWEQVVKVVETRYGAGWGQQADVLQAQVELGNYLDRLLQWQQRRESLVAEINALRSQPPRTPLPRPQPLTPRPLTVNAEELMAWAESRPQVQALKAQITKQEKAVELARKDYFPDVTIGVGYGFRETLDPPAKRPQADFFSTTFMLDLPIWHGSKIKPKIREELERQGAAREAYHSAWDQIAAAIRDRMAKLQRLNQQIQLYQQGIIPQARQAAEASLAAYQVGNIEFARLYQDHIAVYNAELRLQDYLRESENNWAELEWLVGQELPRRPGGKK